MIPMLAPEPVMRYTNSERAIICILMAAHWPTREPKYFRYAGILKDSKVLSLRGGVMSFAISGSI